MSVTEVTQRCAVVGERRNCCKIASLTMSARVKHFLSTLQHALREERHFALMDGVAFAFPTVGSLVIVFRSGLSPTHASLRSQPRS